MIFKTQKMEFIKKAPIAKKQADKVQWDTPKIDINYETIIVDTMEELKKSIKQIKKDKIFSFDYETAPKKEVRELYTKLINSIDETESKDTKYDKKELIEKYKKTSLSSQDSDVFSIQYTGDGKVCYIIWELHKKPELFEYIKKEVMLNKDILKIAFNLKFEAKFTQPCRIANPVADPMLMGIRVSQAVFPEKFSGNKSVYAGFGLKAQARNVFGYTMTEYTSLVDVDNLEFFDDAYYNKQTLATSYAGDDAILSYLLYFFWDKYAKEIPTINPETRYKNYSEWLHAIEMPFFKVIGELEYYGIEFNEKLALEKKKEAMANMSKANENIIALGLKYGLKISPSKTGKTKEVRKFLFDILGAPCEVFSETTGEQSLDSTSISLIKHSLTNKESMTAEDIDALKLVEYIEIIQKMGVLMSSHITGRLKYLDRDSRIRAQYSPFTDTSRLNSSSPNGQNVPRGDNDTLGVRKMYKPAKGKVLVMIDFSGFELRLLAWASKEDKMIEAFKNGDDLHYMASEMFFNKPRSEITKAERSIAKAGIFGFNYGGSGYSLQKTLIKNATFLDIETCENIMQAINKTFPKIKPFQMEMKRFAKDYGFMETIFGYRRLLPDIHSPRPGIVNSATRQAGNTRIQGSAADIMKLAQINIYEHFIDSTRIRQVAQIHDEIMFEIDNDPEFIKETVDTLINIMQQAPIENFPLDIEVEASISDSTWGDKQTYKGSV